jgi:hypothetical protein
MNSKTPTASNASETEATFQPSPDSLVNPRSQQAIQILSESIGQLVMDKAKELEPNNTLAQATLCLELFAALIAGTAVSYANKPESIMVLGMEAVQRVVRNCEIAFTLKAALATRKPPNGESHE